MNALIQTPPKLTTTAAVAMFGPAIMRACSNSSLRFTGSTALALSLAEAARTSVPLTERDVVDAVRAEIGIRHGCRVDALQCMGASWPLLAVGFHATVIPGRADPVDCLLLSDAALTRDQADALSCLARNVTYMLGVTSTDVVFASELQYAVGQFQKLARMACSFAGSTAVIFQKAIAANIHLCVDAAQGAE